MGGSDLDYLLERSSGGSLEQRKRTEHGRPDQKIVLDGGCRLVNWVRAYRSYRGLLSLLPAYGWKIC